MANHDELKRLGERFPNKNVGCGNPSAKILVVTQKEGNEEEDFMNLQRLFRNLLGTKEIKTSVLGYCYYTVFDEELLTDSFFEHFQIILYTFIDGSQLHQHDPADLFDMKWVPECTVEDGAIQRLFVAHSKAEGNKKERIMLCTYPFERVTKEIFTSSKVLFDYFLYTSTTFFEE